MHIFLTEPSGSAGGGVATCSDAGGVATGSDGGGVATGCDNVIVFPLTVMAKLKDILLHLIM